MGHPQPHPYTHNTVDNKSTLLLIISPLLRFFSNQAESFRHRTPHQTQDTSEKQGLAFMVLLAYKLETTGIESQKSKLFICFKIFWHLFAQAAKMEPNFKMKTQFLTILELRTLFQSCSVSAQGRKSFTQLICSIHSKL